MDESELDDELEALQQEELDNKMLGTGSVPADKIQRLPTAPEGGKLGREHFGAFLRSEEYPLTRHTVTAGKAPVHAEEEDEEEELRKLQAEMAM